MNNISKLILSMIVFGLSTTTFAAGKNAALFKKGHQAFSMNCVTCHGDKGDGMGPAGQALKPPPRNFSKDAFKQGCDEASIFKTITGGVPGTAMAPFGHLPEPERKALAHYVFNEFVNKKNENCKSAWTK